jgi:hypothetical protein
MKSAIVVADANYMKNQLNRLQGTNFEVIDYPVFDIEQIMEEENLFDDFFEEVYAEPVDDKDLQIVFWTNKWEARHEFEKMFIYNKAFNIGIQGSYVEQGKDTAFNIFNNYGAEAVGLPSGATFQDFKSLIKKIFSKWDGNTLLGYEVINNIGLVKNSAQLEYLADQREQRIGYFD